MRPADTQAPIVTISHEFAWTFFRSGPKFATPYPDTQFPVSAASAFYKMWIPDLNAALSPNNPSYTDLAALAHRLGGAVLIGHSESMMFSERAALIDPKDVKGIISLESVVNCAKPFTPPQIAVLAKIPILVVFADHLADAAPPYGSMWAKSETQCRALPQWFAKLAGMSLF